MGLKVEINKKINDFQSAGTKVALCEVRTNVMSKLIRSGIAGKVGLENIHVTLSDWIAKGTIPPAEKP